MILQAYSFLDTKAAMWSLPCFFSTDAAALRAALSLAGDLETLTGKHPADFVLFRVGSFDDSVGLLMSEEPRSLGVLAGMLSKKG